MPQALRSAVPTPTDRSPSAPRSHRGLAALALTLLSLAPPACSGGSKGGRGPIDPPLCGKALCVVQCNLGCSRTGCAVTEIAVNQPLILTFSQDIDPRSVSLASIAMKTAAGADPVGSFVTQGQTVTFLPEVRTIGSETFFGFRQGEVYRLRIDGGPAALSPLRSTSGDELAAPLICFLNVSRGVVDQDGRPPEAALVVPDRATGVPVDSEIVVQFSEVIDEAPFANPTPETAPIQFQLLVTDSSGQCTGRAFNLEGTATPVTDRIMQRTMVRFRPLTAMPGLTCVRVEVTPRVHDLANNPAATQRFEFKTAPMPVVEAPIVEDFTATTQLDSQNSGGAWGGGRLVPARLGGTGKHGPFNASDGILLSEVSGIRTWRWSTDNQPIPRARTTTNSDELVTDGRFEFSSFVVGRNERVVWTGSKPAQIRVQGRVDIQGVVDFSGQSAPAGFTGDPMLGSSNPPAGAGQGQSGSGGGPGGGRGGDGANSPSRPAFPRRIDGGDGTPIQLPAGHPFLAHASATAGKGSRAWPQDANSAAMCFSFATISLNLVGGGGGGSNYKTPGTPGATVVTRGVANHPCDLAPPSFDGAAGARLFGPPVALSEAAHYLIGGAGGGGGATHPLESTTQSIIWRAGGGGGGGGGTALFRVGGDFNVATTGAILARGGDGPVIPVTGAGGAVGRAAPGGAGAGGTLLIQVASPLQPLFAGRTDVSGGTGGTMTLVFLTFDYRSRGGNGGQGFLRVETPQALAVGDLGMVAPPIAIGDEASHVGTLSDVDSFSGARSLWYSTQRSFPPSYVRYEIEAEQDGHNVVYSDDATRGIVPVEGQTAVVFLMQCAQLDAHGEPDPASLSGWHATTAALDRERGNGFRFLVRFDKDRATQVAIRRVSVVVRG